MEDDAELLDWGNEDDEQQAFDVSRHQEAHAANPHDEGEDAVSLGGDEDDLQDLAAFQAKYEQNDEEPLPLASRLSLPAQDSEEQAADSSSSSRNRSDTQRESSHKMSRRNSSATKRMLPPPNLTHALPPKPVLVAPSFPLTSPPQASTLASSMIARDRERRLNGHSKGASNEVDSLPPDWEVRYPRNGGRDPYYYNTRTHESTWTRPATQNSGRSSPSKNRDTSVVKSTRGRSPRPTAVLDDALRAQLSDRSGRRREAKRIPSPTDGDSMTYEDRHYRPGEPSPHAATPHDDRREERPPIRLPVRALSPRPTDERRSQRSDTPPRRENRSSEFVRRDFSPPSPTLAGSRGEIQRLSPNTTRGRDYHRNDRSLSPIPQQRARRPPHDVDHQLTPPPQDRNSRSTREWSAHSTLSASSHPTTSRAWRHRSSLGGGYMHIHCACLEKPWELSNAVLYIFPSTSSRFLDALHGPFSFLSPPLSFMFMSSISILMRLVLAFSYCRAQITTTAYS
ncbi:hypothetical protein C8Q75DRAFT_411688 [Abortiporus biennis]|nr:hypothetical protein C8Q75DRAFT_411688 [Abortiporus biennis]